MVYRCSRRGIEELIERSPLSRLAGGLKGLLLPSIRLRTQASADADLPFGVSKTGGMPDLPVDEEWPRLNGVQPLDFILQLRLEDIAALNDEGALPARGLLSFFFSRGQDFPTTAAPCEPWRWRVLHSADDGAPVRRMSRPAGLRLQPLPPRTISFAREWTLPTQREPWFQMLGLNPDPRQPFSGDTAQYYDLLWRLAEVYGADGEPVHRLLGYPETLSCADVGAEVMQSQCWRASASGSVLVNWRLLLQLDGDDLLGDGREGMDRLFCWICQPDLLARRFERACLIRQAHAGDQHVRRTPW